MSNDNNIWEPKAESTVQNTTKLNTNGLDLDFRRVISIWPFILLFGLIGYSVGNIFLRYSTNVYTVSTSISLEENQEVSIGQALYGNPRDPFNDKIAYFKSPVLAQKLVDSLGLQYNSESQGKFKNSTFYKLIKWKILLKPNEEIPEINFSIFPNKAGFHFVSKNIEGDGFWGIPFLINDNKIVVQKSIDFNSTKPIFLYSVNTMKAAFELSNKIEITTSKESNIIAIKYSDISTERAKDILSGLMGLYNHILKLDKSQGFSQAIEFIEQRMSPLRKELDSIENSLASFKSSRALIGTGANSDIYLQKIQDYDKELTQINILEATINAVEEFIKNPKMKDADLSFVGIDNPALQSMLIQYQQMRLQRDKIALTAQETNPTLLLMDKNLSDLRSNMEKQLSNYKNNLSIAQGTYQSKINNANEILTKSPISEKELMDKTRFQNIKEQLYLTLLQKREEAAIAKASITVNTKILFPPIELNSTVTPSKSKVLLISILIGILLPIIFSIFKEILNNKIISKKQLQSMTNIPVLAELEHAENQVNFPFIIEGNNRSMFGEQIRSLRTNLDFYFNSQKPVNYIVITSSVSGEGKSFLSMNIAKSYSLQGKKVAILEFDLRRPKIYKSLGFTDKAEGLTSFLLGRSTLPDIIIPISKSETERLDLFPSGAIPPNPQELIAGENMKNLKKYLDENYDVVVIDTPPYGIVADAQILGKWADITLVITRFQQTVREQILEINEWNQKGVFNNIALVFNGIKNSGYFGYKYGYYYYKRKYGYNYYSSATTNNDKKEN